MRRTFAWIFALFVIGNVVAPSAQAFDSRCFTKEQCVKARGDIILDSPTADTDAFYTGSDAVQTCGESLSADGNGKEQLGFCLPTTQANTKISFGGKQSFANIGDFIQYIYKYGMWLAGITAVGLIIISGFQWAASGGNSDMIGSAKNRISGAVTGLILLALAYTILNTINPYLVQLRLPQTWMINEIGIAPPYCSQIQDKKVAKVGPSDPPPTDTQLELALTNAKNSGYTIEPKAATCGSEYLVEGAGKLSCSGNLCDPDQVCSSEKVDTGNGKIIPQRSCIYGQVVYHLSIAKDLFTYGKQVFASEIPIGKWFLNRVNGDGHWVDYDDMWITPVCKMSNGTTKPGTVFKGNPSELPPKDKNWFRMDFLPKKINGTDTEEYMVRVGGLDTDPNAVCEVGFLKGTLAGYIIGIELDAEAQLSDIKLYTGYSNGKIKFDAGDNFDFEKDYIPLDVIKTGVFGKAALDNSTIDRMYKSKK